MAFDHCGMVHSNCISGVAAVLGRLISTQCQVVPGALVIPAWAHDPAVVPTLQVPLLGLRERGLVPRVPLVHRVAKGVMAYEGLLVLPVLVVGGTEQDADA